MLSCTTARSSIKLMGPRNCARSCFFTTRHFAFAASWDFDALPAFPGPGVLNAFRRTLTKTRRRKSGNAAPRLFSQRPVAARTLWRHAAIVENVHERGTRDCKNIRQCAGAAWVTGSMQSRSQSWDFFWLGPRGAAHFPGDPASRLGPKSSRADLRIGGPWPGKTQLFFHDARHSRAAGIRPHRNHGHLHFGRPSPILSPDALARPFPAIEMKLGENNENRRAWSEIFSGATGKPARGRKTGQVLLDGWVPHRRSGRP